MASEFRGVDREQRFLLPPDMREWLPDDHPVWAVIDLVAGLDLAGFEAAYRLGGRGRRAWDPAVMLTLLIWSYSQGVRSSRRIERLCHENVAWRVIAGQDPPDHSTICRFRQAHEAAIVELLAQTLVVCDRLGMLPLGTLAVDSTRIEADAPMAANRRREALEAEAARVLAEAAAVDEAESEDPDWRVPAELADPKRRAERIRRALAELDEIEAAGGPDRVNVTDPDSRIMATAAGGFVQGYSAQAAVADGQIVLAVEVTAEGNDFGWLCPMVNQARRNLLAAGIGQDPGVVLADAGYWDVDDVADLEAALPDTVVLVATRNRHKTHDPGPDPSAAHAAAVAAARAAQTAEAARRAGIFQRCHDTDGDIRYYLDELGLSQSQAYAGYRHWLSTGDAQARRPRAAVPRPQPKTQARWDMDTRLADPTNRARYRQRGPLIEGTFATIKTRRGGRRFIRRGLDAVNAEFHLDAIAHNITKITAAIAPRPA
jgi:transposase